MTSEQSAVESSGSHRRHSRRRAILWFAAAFIFVQLAVPLYRLALPGIQPFGWQMYSSVAGHSFEIRLADGTTKTADPADYVLRYRSEVDYRNHLPELLCEKFPEATEVVASNPVLKSTETYPCTQ